MLPRSRRSSLLQHLEEGKGDSSAPRTPLARGRKRPCPTLPVSDQAPLCGSGIAQHPLSVSMPKVGTSVQLMALSSQQKLIYREHCTESGRVPQLFRFPAFYLPSVSLKLLLLFSLSSLPFSSFLPTSFDSTSVSTLWSSWSAYPAARELAVFGFGGWTKLLPSSFLLFKN